MYHFTFEWDSTKSDSNLRKHGVSFEEAKTVFTDEFGRLISDPDHSEFGEDRFLLLGTSILRAFWWCAIASGKEIGFA
ncbi:BrnT family toxin [Marinobacter sp.]|uniref:BrnT family toxin n=1 Tax=Marinobacter sp. TaxID=50741 RepID=UPI003A8CAD79